MRCQGMLRSYLGLLACELGIVVINKSDLLNLCSDDVGKSTLTAKHRRYKVFSGTYQVHRLLQICHSQFCCRLYKRYASSAQLVCVGVMKTTY